MVRPPFSALALTLVNRYSYVGMPSPPQTVYANIVNVKITGTEVIFEFGAQFPPSNPQTGKASEFAPEVRVVLGLPAVKAFADILQKAAAQMEGAAAAPQQSETQTSRPTSKQ